MLLLFAFLLAACLNLIGCAHQPVGELDANGICALDFEAKQCWIEKSKNQGFDFRELALQNSRCETGPPDYCWFAINNYELVKLLRARERLKDAEGE